MQQDNCNPEYIGRLCFDQIAQATRRSVSEDRAHFLKPEQRRVLNKTIENVRAYV